MNLKLIILGILGILGTFGTAEAATFPCAQAMPFVFANGTVADATQVNANFSALLNCANTTGRISITTPITMYVGSPGSDANNTCTNILTPCATGQQAFNNLAQFYQFVDGTTAVTIFFNPGSYNQSMSIAGVIPGQQQPSQLLFMGNVGTPDTVSIQGDNTLPAVFDVRAGALVTIQGFKCLGANGDCIRVRDASVAAVGSMDFSTTVTAHMHMKFGGVIHTIGNYTISGGAFRHVWADGASNMQWYNSETINPCCSYGGITVTISGTPAFGGVFLKIQGGYVDAKSITFVSPGSATGTQCNIQDNGTFVTGTAGALVVPGTASTCTTATGGIFD